MRIALAGVIAEKWVANLAPVCERVEIAGSIRREKPEVKDIEIVCIPKFEPVNDMFGQPLRPMNMLEDYLRGAPCVIVKNGPRYKQIQLPEGINLDLFIVQPPAQWGVIFLIRTGSAEFSHRFVTPRKHGGLLPSHLHVKDGAIWSNNHIIETPQERDVFDLAGVPWIEPEERR
jgi:DNA polymerase/3'-5' exonuclease PolX